MSAISKNALVNNFVNCERFMVEEILFPQEISL